MCFNHVRRVVYHRHCEEIDALYVTDCCMSLSVNVFEIGVNLSELCTPQGVPLFETLLRCHLAKVHADVAGLVPIERYERVRGTLLDLIRRVQHHLRPCTRRRRDEAPQDRRRAVEVRYKFLEDRGTCQERCDQITV